MGTLAGKSMELVNIMKKRINIAFRQEIKWNGEKEISRMLFVQESVTLETREALLFTRIKDKIVEYRERMIDLYWLRLY